MNNDKATRNEKCHPKIEKASFGKVEKWLVDEARKVGLDIDGFDHEITNEFVSHVMRRHSNERTEKRSGQVAVKEGDFDKIPAILKNPDYTIVGSKRNNKNILTYAKKMEDGTMLYFEEVLDGKRNKALRGVTMFKRKRDINEGNLIAIVTMNGKTNLLGARIVIGRGGHPPIGADRNVDTTVATSAQSADNSDGSRHPKAPAD